MIFPPSRIFVRNLKEICGVISEKCMHTKSEFENERWKVRVETFERHFDAVEKCVAFALE